MIGIYGGNKKMKYHYFLKIGVSIITLALLLLPAATGMKYFETSLDYQGKNENSVTITISFDKQEFTFDTINGYDFIHYTDGDYLTDPGKPLLPRKTIRVALPPYLKATDLTINALTTNPISGSYIIHPTSPILTTDTINTLQENIYEDVNVYTSSIPYPSNHLSLGIQTDLAGQSMVDVIIYPLQYIPTSHQMIFLESITFTITGTNEYTYGDFLPTSLSAKNQAHYQQMIQELVINPEDVHLQQSTPPQSTSIPPGDYEYVIITQNSWTDDFQPLSDWKNKKGTPATIVTTDWIYGEYSGSNVQKIRSFIIDAHSSWGSLYFLLGGDTDTIPYYTKYILGDGIPSDTYYGDYDDDWTVEVHIGRAPVRSTTQIDTFIDKIFTYEKNPPMSSYAKTAFFCGFDLYTYGSGEGEDCKIDIKNYYLPGDWTYRSEYDSEAGTHRTDVINYLNQGNNLVNHADHCYTNEMGVGSTNHGDALYNADMTSLTNGDRQSILYTMGCYPANFEDPTCIGEAFVQNSNGGGLAFIGNSRYGWYVAYTDNQYSFLYDRYFFRSLFDQNHVILGECFSDHKNDGPKTDDYYRYIYTELTLLGDPELPIWTDTPNEISDVDYPDSISAGTQSFTVTVTDGGNPVNNALVCVHKENEVYKTDMTNANGEASFIITPLTEGTLDVTVTKHNYLPWEGTAQISEGSLTNGILLIGLITNLESNGDYVTSNAILVFYFNVNSLASNLYSANEHIVVSDNYQGYIGPNFLCGVFSAAVN